MIFLLGQFPVGISVAHEETVDRRRHESWLRRKRNARIPRATAWWTKPRSIAATTATMRRALWRSRATVATPNARPRPPRPERKIPIGLNRDVAVFHRLSLSAFYVQPGGKREVSIRRNCKILRTYRLT